MMRRLTLILAVACAALLAPQAATAQATRTWVSGLGDDVNPCSRTAPCKTFAGAISKTAAGGEINCIDPGGFGAVTITKSIAIKCDGVEAGVLVVGTNGIVVNTPAGSSVYLSGLDIEGTGSGLSGILFIQAGSLHVENCLIRGFNAGAAHGINFAPTVTSQLYVSDTYIAENGTGTAGGGILIKPVGAAGVNAVIERTRVFHNFFGVTADGTGNSIAINLTVRDSVIAGNSNNGIAAISPSAGGAVTVLVDSSSIASNVGSGLFANGVVPAGRGSATIRVGGSSVHANVTGAAASGQGQLRSYKNNFIDGNANNGTPLAQAGLN